MRPIFNVLSWASSAGKIDGARRAAYDVARADLSSQWRLAVGTVLMYEIILHIKYKVNGVHVCLGEVKFSRTTWRRLNPKPRR
jgi:hypothetical protein